MKKKLNRNYMLKHIKIIVIIISIMFYEDEKYPTVFSALNK